MLPSQNGPLNYINDLYVRNVSKVGQRNIVPFIEFNQIACEKTLSPGKV